MVVSNLTEVVKLQGLNGKYFERSDQMIRVEEKGICLDIDEIFLFVARKLTLREREELRSSGGRSHENETKLVRAATAEPRRNSPSNSQETDKGNKPVEKNSEVPRPEQRRPSVSPRRNSWGEGGVQVATSSNQNNGPRNFGGYSSYGNNGKGVKGGNGK